MKPARRSAGDPSRLTASLRAARRCVSVEIHPGQFSRWGLLPHAPCQPGVSPASALTRVPPPAVNRVAARRSSLRFGRNTPGPVLPVGAPLSRALSAGRLAPTGRTGQPRRSPGFHHRLLPAPLRGALRCVSVEYTRASSPGGGSSLTRLVSRAPHRPRRSPGFHHRLLTASLRAAHRCVSVEIHAVFLPHAPCQPDPHRENWASPLSALTRVPPQAVK